MDTKKWYFSKTIITAAVSFAVTIATGAGYLTVEQGATVVGALVSLALIFLRTGQGTEVTK